METMKDSGIKWIGKVPSSWRLIRMKDCSYMKGRIGWQGLTADEFIEEGPYLVTGTDFDSGHVCWDRSYHVSEKRYEEAPEIQLKIGDLLVTKDGTIGKLAFIDELPDKACLNSHLLVIRPLYNQYVNRYLYWVLSSPVFQGYYEQMSYGSTMNSLSQENIGGFHFFVPSIAEQERIADFLDTHCAKLDKIITNLERQIELLQKYKKSLITETVTKGLDKNVEMKDSGIEWIGMIPKNWKIKRLKYLSEKIGSGKTPKGGSEIYEAEGVVFIRSQNVYDDGLHLDDAQYINDYIDADMQTTRLKKGDILFNITGASIARCCLYNLDDRGNVNQHVCIIRLKKEYSNSYYRYVMSSEVGKVQTAINQMGGNRESLTFEQIGNFYVPLPPAHEQAKIAAYLDTESAKINELIAKNRKALGLLYAHKTSLIYEYVTGKKRIKEVV